MTHFIYDGTYSGFLTAVFEAFERKLFQVTIGTEGDTSLSMFDIPLTVHSDSEKSRRVHKGLVKKIGRKKADEFYKNFLSEDPKAIQAGFRLIISIFQGAENVLDNFGHDDVVTLSQTLKKVHREQHRMRAFLRFSKSSDGMYFAVIEPDFNVLPLISDFFRKRYADQSWIIYDVHRKYGLYYDGLSVREVTIENDPNIEQKLQPAVTVALDDREEFFQNLWKQYFKSTNIVARKNLKLHIQHVPKRYWKYLVEKQE